MNVTQTLVKAEQNHFQSYWATKLSLILTLLTVFVVLLCSPKAQAQKMYWTDARGIYRAERDSTNIEHLVKTESDDPQNVADDKHIAVDVGGGKIYWTDNGTDKIQRSNLDATHIEDLVTGLSNLHGIAVDASGRKIYWTEGYHQGDIFSPFTGKIRRANLDGTNVEDLITAEFNPTDIAIDAVGGKIYWTDDRFTPPFVRKIQRANLDGAHVEDLVTTGLANPRGIAIDAVGRKIYWTTWDIRTPLRVRKIQRANLDGTNVENLVTNEEFDLPINIAVDAGRGKMYWTTLDTGKIRRANLDGTHIEDLITGLVDPRYIAFDLIQLPSDVPQINVEVTKASLEEVVAEVQVQNVEGLFGFQFDLRFNPEILEVTQIDEGDFLKSIGGNTFWTPPQIDNNAGDLIGVLGARLTLGAVRGSGTLATITFKVKKLRDSWLDFANVKMSNEAGEQIIVYPQPSRVDIPISVSATLKVTPRIEAAFVVVVLQVLEPVNLSSFSVDLAFPSGLEPSTVENGSVSGNVIQGITTPSTFKFQIYEGGDFQFVLRNGRLVGPLESTGVPKLESGSITVVASPAWDVNRDYVVNIFDLVVLGGNFGQRISGNPRPNPDINGDGTVDIFDFVQVGSHFGEAYNPIPGVAATPPVVMENWKSEGVDAPVHLSFLQQMVAEIDQHPLANTPEFVKVRSLLAKLIALPRGLPTETRLLQNFPNPFNPETWIPFHLAQDTDVKIQIYDMRGQIVRTLSLGRLKTGYYDDRLKAAYWNGISETGEIISSGVYFYHLRAGDYSAVRRMVILK